MDRSEKFFHDKCLSSLDTKFCPVCYYIKNPTLLKNLVCMKCGTKDTLWFCIICGHVGCGYSIQRHGIEHFRESKHIYAMGLNDFRVWDYKNEMWLHQLEAKDHKLDNFKTFTPANTGSCSCSCYACEYNRKPKLLKKPTCMECNESEISNLWICMFCSHVGCNRLKNKHARQHYSRTNHNLVLQLGDFSIWDYKEKKYQHRKPISCAIKPQINRSESQCIEEEFLKRMDLLERQWQEFNKLTETNKRIITIESRLLNLTDQKKVLEEKLNEHDSKLNKLISQFDNNNYETCSPKKHIRLEQVETAARGSLKNPNLTPNSNCCVNSEIRALTIGQTIGSHSPTTISSINFSETKFVLLIILGIIVHYFLRPQLTVISQLMSAV